MTRALAMATAMRTHTCGELRAADAGEEVTLCGWVAHRRDHGGVTFIDLRDRDGVVQVVFHPEDAAEAHAAAQALRGEWVVRVTGAVRERPEGMREPGARDRRRSRSPRAALEVLAEAETPPFVIEDRVEADELLRLEYRYLDLRRPEMTQSLRDAPPGHADHARAPRRARVRRGRDAAARPVDARGRARLPRAVARCGRGRSSRSRSRRSS